MDVSNAWLPLGDNMVIYPTRSDVFPLDYSDVFTGLHSKAYRYMHGSKGLGCFLNQLIMPLGVAEAVDIIR